MCFVWISEQTAVISVYSINWLVFITVAECLLRGADWVFNSDIQFRPQKVKKILLTNSVYLEGVIGLTTIHDV